MKHSYCNSYKNINIRPLEQEHIEDMRILRNKHKDCFIYSEEISSEAQIVWYNKYLSKPDDYVFSVYYEDKWIGTVSIYGISGNEAEFGRLLISKQDITVSGLGTDTTICACNLAYEQLGINRIILQVYEDNTPAYKSYLNAGFSEYGHSLDPKGKKLIDMELVKFN